MIKVCPECDHADVRARSGAMPDIDRSGDAEATYRCPACKARFDEPERRERRGTSVGRRGLAGALVNADSLDDLAAGDDA